MEGKEQSLHSAFDRYEIDLSSHIQWKLKKKKNIKGRILKFELKPEKGQLE